MKTFADYDKFLEENGLLGCKQRSFGDRQNKVAQLLQERAPVSIIEIGRGCGYSFGMFRYFCPDAYVMSVENFSETHGFQGQKDWNDRIEAFFAEKYGDGYEFVTGDVRDVADLDRTFDFILIDGEHGYEWTKLEWDILSKKARPGAVVVFDDLYNKGGEKAFLEGTAGLNVERIAHKGFVYI